MVQSSGSRIFSAVLMKFPKLNRWFCKCNINEFCICFLMDFGHFLFKFYYQYMKSTLTHLLGMYYTSLYSIINGVTYLAHGLIFRASPLLIQKPAPPVANQNLTGIWKKIKATSILLQYYWFCFQMELELNWLSNKCTYGHVVDVTFWQADWPFHYSWLSLQLLWDDLD